MASSPIVDHHAASNPVQAYAGDRARKPLRRRTTIALALAVLMYPFYLLVANLLLATGAIEALANTSKEVRVEFDSATSWFPGYASVKGFRLRIEDKNLEAYLDLPRADVRISMFALLRREFHATRVRGTGARFYLRLRVPAVTRENAARVAAYPRIPGLGPVPLAFAGPHPLEPISPNLKELWKVQLDDVDTSVDELWFQEYRYVGRGIAKGGFRLEPMQRVRVGPASLEVDPGVLSAEPHVVATEFGGRLAITVREFEVMKEKGTAPVAFIDAKVLLTGKLPDLAVLGLYSSPPPVTASKGQFRVEGNFVNGAFDEGAEAHVDLARLTFTRDALRIEGPLSGSARAPTRGTLVLGADTAQMTVRAADGDAVASITEATARATLEAADISKSVSVVDGKVHAAAEVQKMRELFAALGVDAVHAGHGRLALDGTMQDDAVSAVYSADLAGMEIALGKSMRALADAKIHGKASGDKSLSELMLSDIRVQAPRFSMRRNEGGTARGSWLDVVVPRVRIHSSGGGPALALCVSFAGDAATGDSAALAALVDVGLLRGIVAQALDGTKARARVQGAVVGSRAELEVLSANAGDLEAKGVYVTDQGAIAGAFLLQLDKINVGLEIKGGGSSVSPLVSDGWIEEHAARLRGPKPCPLGK